MFAAIVFETCSRIPVGLPQQVAKSSFAMSLAANKAAVETAMDLKQLGCRSRMLDSYYVQHGHCCLKLSNLWKLRQISQEFHGHFFFALDFFPTKKKCLYTLNQGFDIVTLFSLHFCRNKVTDSSGRDRKLTKFFPGQTQNDRNHWDLLGNFPTRPGEQKKHCNTFQHLSIPIVQTANSTAVWPACHYLSAANITTVQRLLADQKSELGDKACRRGQETPW